MISKTALLSVFVVLLAGTTAMMIVLQRHGAPLGTKGGITGSPARTFRDWVTDHAEEFRA